MSKLKTVSLPLEPHPNSSHPSSQEPSSSSHLLQARQEKLQRLKSQGIAPYPTTSEITAGRLGSKEIKKKFDSLKHSEESKETVRFCGRMLTRREMGKASFAHLQDLHGTLQIYLRQDSLGEENYSLFIKDLDLGDILGCEGKIFRTKTEELTLRAEKIALLAKSLKPLPEKWHGLKDIEIRSRQRELDLIANQKSKEVFQQRSLIIQTLRQALLERGYLEVETPMMQSVPSGAIAKPFETYHNALDQKFFLRVAPELYLKRCLVGGLEKVFEIGRVFRNEGMDSLHNPEFTILEAYEAYGNMKSMMELTKYLIGKVLDAGFPLATKFPDFKKGAKVTASFSEATVNDLFKKYVGQEEAKLVEEQKWHELLEKIPEETLLGSGILSYKTFDYFFSKKIAPNLQEPTFVTEFPSDLSPLAKKKDGNPQVTERFELYISGEEIANAYSELNDPVQQRENMEKYRLFAEQESMGYDESFIAALEYGMPPAGGLGIGVDRLVMLFTGQRSIREVLLFPTLKAL